jgi:hypothetical protein
MSVPYRNIGSGSAAETWCWIDILLALVHKHGSNPLMRVDSCTAGQSVTYRFLASKLSSNVSDPVDAEQPDLVVTFFQTRI